MNFVKFSIVYTYIFLDRFANGGCRQATPREVDDVDVVLQQHILQAPASPPSPRRATHCQGVGGRHWGPTGGRNEKFSGDDVYMTNANKKLETPPRSPSAGQVTEKGWQPP